MALPRPSSPRVVLNDLKQFLAGQDRHKLPFAIASVLMPCLIVWGFVVDSRSGIAPGRAVVFVQNWRADRSDSDIKAQQKVDQARKDALQRERRDQYRRVADQLGIAY